MLHELLSLEWLAGQVAKHVIGGTILDFQMPFVDAILDEIIPDVYMPCPFT
jgi:hypothetical protein